MKKQKRSRSKRADIQNIESIYREASKDAKKRSGARIAGIGKPIKY